MKLARGQVRECIKLGCALQNGHGMKNRKEADNKRFLATDVCMVLCGEYKVGGNQHSSA